MKAFLLLIILSVSACKPKQDVEHQKRAAYLQMERKVNEVVVQMRNDCDSNLLSTARAKADSILNKRRDRSKVKQKLHRSGAKLLQPRPGEVYLNRRPDQKPGS